MYLPVLEVVTLIHRAIKEQCKKMGRDFLCGTEQCHSLTIIRIQAVTKAVN